MNSEYYTSKEVLELLKIHQQTLYRWRKKGKIDFIKLGRKTFLYRKTDIEKLLQIPQTEDNNRKNVIYCRVSNTKQKNDLQSQKQLLIDYCNSNGFIPDLILSEVASGMNENRTEFNKLIDLVINNEVDKIFISYKDRLTRFGFDYFKNLFSKFGTEIIILNNQIDVENFEKELTEDLVSIIHHFSMKMYSNRRKKLKDLKKQLEI